MKKINVVFSVLVAVVLFLASCNPDPDGLVTITVDQGDTTLVAGESVTFKITLNADADADGELGAFTVLDGTTALDSATYSGTAETVHTFTYTMAEDATEGDDAITLTFEAKDGASGNTTTKQVLITVGTPALVLEVYPSAQMTAQGNDNSMLYNLSDGTVHTPNSLTKATGADIDLCFIHQDGDDRKFGLYAPSDDYSVQMGEQYGSWLLWSTRNATKLEKDNTLDPSTITVEEVQALTVADNTGVPNLVEGDVLKFETVNGRKGLILIGATANSKIKGNQKMYVEVTIEPASASTK